MPSTKVGETIGFFTQGVLVFMVYFSFETLFSTIIIIERRHFSINIIRLKTKKKIESKITPNSTNATTLCA